MEVESPLDFECVRIKFMYLTCLEHYPLFQAMQPMIIFNLKYLMHILMRSLLRDALKCRK